MAETTTHETEVTREETAELLRSIADQLDSGRSRVQIPVGNKRIQLSPPEAINSVVTVTERSRRLRKDTEELSLEFEWNPVRDTAESDDESGAESGTDEGADR